MQGTISSFIGMLSELTLLYLYDNKINSTIPVELNRLSKLVELRLSSNQLEGTVPDLSSLPLTHLFLHRNRLTGPVSYIPFLLNKSSW